MIQTVRREFVNDSNVASHINKFLRAWADRHPKKPIIFATPFLSMRGEKIDYKRVVFLFFYTEKNGN